MFAVSAPAGTTMKDVVTFLEKTLIRSTETLAALSKAYEEHSAAILDYNAQLRTAQIDARVLSTAMADGKYRKLFEGRISTLTEYAGRCTAVATRFTRAHPQLDRFVKQLRVQVTMLQAQIRYQYDTFDNQEIVDTITGNIQALSNLITTVNEKISKFQADAMMLRDLTSKQRSLLADLNNYVDAMRS